jgi:hypothetical protein
MPGWSSGQIVAVTVAFLCLFGRVSTTRAGVGEPESGHPVVALLPASTVVEATAPRGWTHLVIKSVPRIESGDIETLPALAQSTATLFRTVIVADVRRPADRPGSFRLERIGLGLCVPFERADTVVTTTDDTPAHASLGLIERQVLGRAEEELKKGRILASSSTFTLYGGPCTLGTRSGHVEVWLLYGLLVDATTGGLTTVVWAIPARSSSSLAPATLVQLGPRLVYTCGLDVAAERLLGTVPINWSFAIRMLPPGKTVVIPRELRERFLRPRDIAADPTTFERQLRGLLQQPQPTAPRAARSGSPTPSSNPAR